MKYMHGNYQQKHTHVQRREGPACPRINANGCEDRNSAVREETVHVKNMLRRAQIA